MTLILYRGVDEYFEFDGTPQEAINYVKRERRYRNYGRDGASIYTAKRLYDINGHGQERHYCESTEYGYA